MSEAKPELTHRVSCEHEPIHIPGAIQPFGVLLVLDQNTLQVRNASGNSQDVFGSGAASPLGATAGELLGPAAEAALRDALAKDGLTEPRPIPLAIPGTEAKRWHGAAHCLDDKVFVELEPTDERAESAVDLLATVRAAILRLSATATVLEFCSIVAREIRLLTGYDRVMVYRFDTEWNGEVIAEERRADQESFLGLHYPASDIPALARDLFRINRIRVIPDIAYEPVPLVPDRDEATGLPVDLSRCLLRSVAPVHREYLHNMAVRASLAAALVIGGRLWGLIACHHSTPKHPGPTEREACDILTQMASARLAVLAETEDQEYLTILAETLARTAARVAPATPPIAALAKDPTDLFALVGATGALVWRSGRGMPVGQTPPADAFPELIAWVKSSATPLLATDGLPRVYAPAKAFAAVASGLLALEVSRDTEEYVLWFRPEALQSVSWAGDPHGKADATGRMSPRRSFALWKETVRDRSVPWRPAEVENARRVKELVLAAAARSAFQLEALLSMCAWCKNVRNEPGYWQSVEEFISDLFDVQFSHGICPACAKKQMGALADLLSQRREIG